MNEKIKELAHEADFIHKRHNGSEWRWGYIDPELNAKLEKFAELIVKECIIVCKTGGVSNSDYNTGRLHCAVGIKEHFGIEK